MAPRRDSTPPTPERTTELPPVDRLARMQQIANDFYRSAITQDVHAFIEFAGLLNEFIAVCRDAQAQGIDFAHANVHSGRPLPLHEVRAAYLAEKLKCIYGTALSTNFQARQAFMDTLFGAAASATDASPAERAPVEPGDWGMVRITGGKYKGCVGEYDDDESDERCIVYLRDAHDPVTVARKHLEHLPQGELVDVLNEDLGAAIEENERLRRRIATLTDAANRGLPPTPNAPGGTSLN